MDLFGFDPSSYSIAIYIFLKLLGAIYICAYFPLIFQIKGLVGEEGIRPIHEFLAHLKKFYGKKSYYYVPSLFWFNSSDAAIVGLVWTALALSLLLIFGICTPLVLLLLYLCHLSLTSAVQDFLSFGWETFLMEITLSAFLMTLTTPYNIFGWLSLNFLLFRFYIQAGVSKIKSHDINWRNFTAIAYHYLTQPLPNTTAWYFHQFPLWFHKFSVGVMFYAELIAPLFMFSPPWGRLFAFTQMAGLQWSIWLTGNLSYLNHMTIFCCVILIHNQFLEPFFGVMPQEQSSPWIWQTIVSMVALPYFLLQVINLWQTFFPGRLLSRILIFVQPFHWSYPHGIFAIMTTKRHEIIVEGSMDGIDWKPYEFYYKPGDLKVRPKRVSPFQPRLDWQAWFLPFRHFDSNSWFAIFLVKILMNSKPVLKLLKTNPFPDHAPRIVRALIYDYEFTTREERRLTGDWWKRRYIGIFVKPISLTSFDDKY